MDVPAHQIPESVKVNDLVGFYDNLIGRKNRILKTALLLHADGLDDPTQEVAVQGDGFIDLDKDRFRHDRIVEAIEKTVGGILKRPAKLKDKVFQGDYQGQFRVVEDLKVLEQAFIQGIHPSVRSLTGNPATLRNRMSRWIVRTVVCNDSAKADEETFSRSMKARSILPSRASFFCILPGVSIACAIIYPS